MSTDNSVMRQMPKYKCHKEVWALKIKHIVVKADGGASITPSEAGYAGFEVSADWMSRYKGTTDDLGYFVVYKGGYKSWSPTKAFEEGYTKI